MGALRGRRTRAALTALAIGFALCLSSPLLAASQEEPPTAAPLDDSFSNAPQESGEQPNVADDPAQIEEPSSSPDPVAVEEPAMAEPVTAEEPVMAEPVTAEEPVMAEPVMKDAAADDDVPGATSRSDPAPTDDDQSDPPVIDDAAAAGDDAAPAANNDGESNTEPAYEVTEDVQEATEPEYGASNEAEDPTQRQHDSSADDVDGTGAAAAEEVEAQVEQMEAMDAAEPATPVPVLNVPPPLEEPTADAQVRPPANRIATAHCPLPTAHCLSFARARLGASPHTE